MRYFQLTRDSASAILKKYDHKYLQHFKYNQSLKAWVITDEFKPSQKIKNFNRYLEVIKSSRCEVISQSIE